VAPPDRRPARRRRVPRKRTPLRLERGENPRADPRPLRRERRQIQLRRPRGGRHGGSFDPGPIDRVGGGLHLLWDYSDGNPRAALHFFLRSLDAERGDRVRVRLFRAPDVDRLEAGGFAGLFVLAGVVTHESISFDHLVEVTRLERPECFIHLDRMAELGAVVCENDLYRVSATWHRAAVRLLRRRNLLPA
jgi:hypothetical protein